MCSGIYTPVKVLLGFIENGVMAIRPSMMALGVAYAEEFHYTASFDLTACYDSLDHHVLKYFLKRFGLDHEFCEQLSSWLEAWTVTERGIFHHHGIPQGPLSSSLLTEGR